MLPRKLTPDDSETERRRWRIVRLDDHRELSGEILSADVEMGICVMRERGPDEIAENGTRTPTFKAVDYSLGARGLIIVGR